jgi:hypothetical protein
MEAMRQGDVREEIGSKSTCDTIITLFLVNLSHLFNRNLYRIACILFRTLRECANEHLYEIAEEEQRRKKL